MNIFKKMEINFQKMFLDQFQRKGIIFSELNNLNSVN